VTVLRGVAASPGRAGGPAWLVAPPELALPAGPVADREAEARRLEGAVARVARRLGERAAATTGDPAAILDAQAEMALDPELLARSARLVRTAGVPAARAVVEVGEEFAGALAASTNEYLAARAADVRDVCRQVAAELLGIAPGPSAPASGPCVLLAHDLSPADTAALDLAAVRALATEAGSRTSHTAIVARALGIPAVVAVPGLLAAVEAGREVLVDGDAGTVDLDPGPGTVAGPAGEAAAEPDREPASLAEAVTTDGHRIELAVNVGGVAELRAARRFGAASVGLYRTELTYLRAAAAPSEDVLASTLGEMAGLLAGGRLVVRTFDFGADKLPAFLAGGPAEVNPALGVRGIRLARRHPDLLGAQLRAVARAAAASGRLAVMAPMVATVEEADWFLAACREAGCAAAGVEVGLMVEVPAAVFSAGELAARVDFLSIGTNDLCQYLHAGDRQEDPFAPALLRAVRRVTEAAAGQAWVGVCGEAAADPLWATVAAGLGVDELSMSASGLAAVHRALGARSAAECRAAAGAALGAAGAGEARRQAAAALGGVAEP
jgi:phosphotransferase system enzyme I (PtsI)